MTRNGIRAAWLAAGLAGALVSAAAPGGTTRAAMERYNQLLSAARAEQADTKEAERLNRLSFLAAKAGQQEEAERLLNQAIAALPAPSPARASSPARAGTAPASGGAPVFILPFTHHYAGPGGYYPTPAEVRDMGALLVRHRVPGTLFFDGILVERLQKEAPDLIRQIRDWNLPLGYHGEETHGPYPVASELLGEVYTLHEAQGYKGPWSLTTGQPWDAAVKAVTERYSHARPWTVDEATRRLDRRKPSATDLSREGGLALVQTAFGKDISMMPSHALESAPEGFAFRRMSRFGFDQPAVPLALHALRIFKIAESADAIMRIAGAEESLFWHMGRLTCKGDDAGESGYRLGGIRTTLAALDRSRPRLLLMGLSNVNEAEFARTVQYLETEFFPANPGSGWVSGDTLPARFEPEKGWRPALPEIRETAAALARDWAGRPPDRVVLKDRTVSLCDAFEVLARAWAATEGGRDWPPSAETHPLYGPVAEDDRARLTAPASVTPASLRTAAARLVREWDAAAGERFVPATVSLPEGRLNAAEFLLALARGFAGPDGARIAVAPSRLFPPYADTLQAVFKPVSPQPLCYTQGQLWTVKPARLAGAAPLAAPAPAPTNAVRRAAAPAGRLRLVFAANLDSETPCFRDSPEGADLYEAEFDPGSGAASGLRRLTRRPGLPEWFPALSPDLGAVIYNAQEAGPNGRKRQTLRRIALATGEDEEWAPEGRFAAFSGDGARVVYSRQERGGVHTLLQAPVSAATGYRRGAESVLADSAGLGAELAEDPSPFPDGRTVAFHWKKAESPGAGVAVIGPAGSAPVALSPFDGCGHAAVSPDGNAVACTRSRDGRLILIRRTADGWGRPGELALPADPAAYAAFDTRFASVTEVRHSYIDWVAPELLLVTTHGANGPRDFRFARLFLVRLGAGAEAPALTDLSTPLEALAGKTGRDFCSASGRWRP